MTVLDSEKEIRSRVHHRVAGVESSSPQLFRSCDWGRRSRRPQPPNLASWSQNRVQSFWGLRGMIDESRGNPEHGSEAGSTVEMPRPSVAPLVVALGTTLLLAGLALSTAISIVGAVLLAIGIGTWIANLLPGRGHEFERLGTGPQPIVGKPGTVARLEEGMPGYRIRLPEKVRPISAGIKGGIWGGIVMPLPALAYSLASGHGIWYPLNLLAGIALPGVGDMPIAELQKFQLPLFIVGVGAHAITSVTLGLLYGVLLPTLPSVAKPIAWGAC